MTPTPNSSHEFTQLNRLTADGTAQNIEGLSLLFPEVITETLDENGRPTKAVNFEALQQLLSDHLVDPGKERYELTWPGKQQARFTAHQPIAKTLRPNRSESVDFDTTQNLFIEGDNLDALKILRNSYLGKVKLIYIDPPYNTGNDFVYKDNFGSTRTDYLITAEEADEEGNRLVSNTSSNGKFHSIWLSMIYSRILIAKQLLADDGVLAISIDDKELINLAKICEEIFDKNEIKIIAIKMSELSGVKMKSVNLGGTIPKLKEYLVFIKRGGIRDVPFDKIPKQNRDTEYNYFIDGVTEDEVSNLKNLLKSNEASQIDKAKKIVEKFSFVSVVKKMKELDILEETHKDKFWFENAWRIIQFVSVTPSLFEKVKKESVKHNGATAFILSANSGINYIFRTGFSSSSKKPRCQIIFADDNLETHPGDLWTDIRTTGIDAEGGVSFKNGKKPLKLMRRIIKTVPDDSIIVDFFAGSSSTAHSIMLQNSIDGGSRRFIMVQLPEELKQPETLDNGTVVTTIADLSRERIRRAAAQIRESTGLTANSLDLGFRALTVDDTNFANNFAAADKLTQDDLLGQLSSVKTGRTGEDLLFQTLLSLGLPLDVDIKTREIAGTEVYSVAGGSLLACFEPALNEALVTALAEHARDYAKDELIPVDHLVLLDSAFETDASRINAGQIFKQLSPETSLRVI